MIWTALGAVYLIWGSTYLAIRFTVETTPPFLSAAARFIISGGVLYLWRRLAGDPAPTQIERRNAALVGIFLLVGGNGGVVWAAQFIPSSLSALLVATVPLWMLLFDAVRPRGERPTGKALSGILIGFCGAALLIGWTASRRHTGKFLRCPRCRRCLASVGHRLDLRQNTSPAAIAADNHGNRNARRWRGANFRRLDIRRIHSIRSYRDIRAFSLGLALLDRHRPVAFVAYAWLLRNAPIPLVATYSYVNPLVAILLGYFLGKEIITMRILLAAGLIIGSVVLVSGQRSVKPFIPDKFRIRRGV